MCLVQVLQVSSDGLHDVMEWLIKHQPSSYLTWWHFQWTSLRRSETHLLPLTLKTFIMIDLSYLTEEEQEMILTVLKRDAELKKLEEQRIKWVQAKDFWWIKNKRYIYPNGTFTQNIPHFHCTTFPFYFFVNGCLSSERSHPASFVPRSCRSKSVALKLK